MRIFRKPRTLLVATSVLFALGAAASPAPQNRQNQKKRLSPAVADERELRSYILTHYKVRELGVAISDLADYQDAHPEVASAMTANGPQGDIAHLSLRIQKYPEVVKLLRRDGFTPREYVVATMALEQALDAVTAKLNGAYTDYPPQTMKRIGKTNLTFVEKNLDEIVRMIDSLSPSTPDPSPPDDSGLN